MKKRTIVLASLAALMVTCAALGTAWGYFTTFAEAKGGMIISLGDESKITETVQEMTKHVVITADDKSGPVYVRVKALIGEAYQDRLTYTGEGWNKGSDGYYYYDGVISKGQETGALDIKICEIPAEENLNEFNVVVVYETCQVIYGEDGEPVAKNSEHYGDTSDGSEPYYGWNAKADTEGGQE